MHIVDFAANLNIQPYLLVFAIIFVFNILLFKKLSFSRYDPIWIMVLSLSFNLTLAVYEFIFNNAIKLKDIIYIFVGFFGFIMGSYVVKGFLGVWRDSEKRSIISRKECDNGNEFNIIRMFLLLATGIIVILSVISGYFLGITILSEDPEYQKVMVNRGGFGFISRITGPLLYCCLVLLFYIKNSRKKHLKFMSFYFVVPILLILSSGSKGALLGIFIPYYFATAFISTQERKPIINISNRVVLYSALGVLLYACLVIFLSAGGVSEANTYESIFKLLFARFVAFGDATYYFFTNGLHQYISYSPLDYLWQYLIVPTFAVFRIVEYEKTLGLEISGIMFGVENTGPNPTMFVEGLVFFGYIGGVVYCVLLGMLFSLFRFMAIGLQINNNLLRLLAFCVGNAIALTICFDMILFVGGLFNNIMVIPLLIIVCVVIVSAVKKLPVGNVAPIHVINNLKT